MNSDLTFITNEENKNLSERFKVLIKDTRLFDVLVGYFYTSGFHAIYKSLENTEKIRILIGINTNKRTTEFIQNAKSNHQLILPYSHAEAKEQFDLKPIDKYFYKAGKQISLKCGIILIVPLVLRHINYKT